MLSELEADILLHHRDEWNARADLRKAWRKLSETNDQARHRYCNTMLKLAQKEPNYPTNRDGSL